MYGTKTRLALEKIFQMLAAVLVMVVWINFVTLIIGVFGVMYALATWFERYGEIEEERQRRTIRIMGSFGSIRR